jgi:hypothetical protein
MPFRCAALLIALACLVTAAPAAASERSEARAYAAALKVDLVPAQADYDAWLADYRFRAGYVAATCLDVVKQGVRDHDRGIELFMLYTIYALRAPIASEQQWSRTVDDRLAAIPTRSRALRRGRAARRVETAALGAFVAAAPDDFCREIRDWQAKGWKGRSASLKRWRTLEAEGDAGGRRAQRIVRAVQVLERHGATRRVVMAFTGTRPAPVDEPELPSDPVFEALEGEPERESPGGGPTRRP